MPKGLGAGDRLASGAVKATFLPGETVSDKKWKAAFGDFNAEKFRRGNAGSESTGSTGTQLEETKPSKERTRR